jgi:protein-disulfide isomerase
LPKIEADYIKAGKVKYVVMDFPIESIHKEAFKAAEAANCSGEQGKYWEMHSRLFGHQKALKEKDWSGHAQALGLDLGKFKECLVSGKYTDEIRRDIAEGRKAGVRGTPTFLLGLTKPDAPMVIATQLIRGAQPYSRFKEVIESLLSSKK